MEDGQRRGRRQLRTFLQNRTSSVITEDVPRLLASGSPFGVIQGSVEGGSAEPRLQPCVEAVDGAWGSTPAISR